MYLCRKSSEPVVVLLDEESWVLRTVLRVVYLGQATTRAPTKTAAAHLLAILGIPKIILILLSTRLFK